jgi:hypothetical protein
MDALGPRSLLWRSRKAAYDHGDNVEHRRDDAKDLASPGLSS